MLRVAPKGPQGRILVVDDQTLNRAATREILLSAGYDVECAHDGRRALEMLEGSTFDLVLLDIEMPGLSGHETASAMQRAERGAIRLAALTVDTSAARRLRSEEVGMVAHIGRPIPSGALLSEVERLCGLALEKRFDPWRREDYKELVARLGLDRMRLYLQQFHHRLCDLLKFKDDAAKDVMRAVHDLASIGGMMGFLSFAGCCIEFMAACGADGERSLPATLVEAARQVEVRLAEHIHHFSVEPL